MIIEVVCDILFNNKNLFFLLEFTQGSINYTINQLLIRDQLLYKLPLLVVH